MKLNDDLIALLKLLSTIDLFFIASRIFNSINYYLETTKYHIGMSCHVIAVWWYNGSEKSASL